MGMRACGLNSSAVGWGGRNHANIDALHPETGPDNAYRRLPPSSDDLDEIAPPLLSSTRIQLITLYITMLQNLTADERIDLA